MEASERAFCQYEQRDISKDVLKNFQGIMGGCSDVKYMNGMIPKIVNGILDFAQSSNKSNVKFGLVGFGFDTNLKNVDNSSEVLLNFDEGGQKDAMTVYRERLHGKISKGYADISPGLKEAEKLFKTQAYHNRLVVLIAWGHLVSKSDSAIGDDEKTNKQDLATAQRLHRDNIKIIVVRFDRAEKIDAFATSKDLAIPVIAGEVGVIKKQIFKAICDTVEYRAKEKEKDKDGTPIIVIVAVILAAMVFAAIVAGVLVYRGMKKPAPKKNKAYAASDVRSRGVSVNTLK